MHPAPRALRTPRTCGSNRSCKGFRSRLRRIKDPVKSGRTASYDVAQFTPGSGTVRRVFESGMVKYATFNFLFNAIAVTGEGVVSDTSTI